MTLGEFARVVGNLKGVTEYLYLHVLGEPLTHPMLPTFIEYANKSGYKVAITTNSTLLDRLGDALISCGTYKVNISLHSFEKEKNTDALEKYLLSCIDFAEKASKSGVLCVLRLWNGGELGRDSDRVLNEKALELLHARFGEVESSSPRGARIQSKLHLEYGDRFEWPDAAIDELSDRVFCYGLSDHFGILSDGTVIPCCLDADGAIALGNIFESDIRSILSSERAVAIKEGFSQKRAVEPLCKRCAYARRFKL